MAQYFGTTPKNDWNPNGPAESGHNFIQRISDKDAEIAAKNKQYQDYQANVNGARTDYNQAIQNQQNYGDLWNQAKQSEDVEAAKAQYQKSANAVNATRTAMTNLPSTINAGSNVVLNSSQRNAALGNQMNKYVNTLGYWTNQNATDENMYQKALGVAQNLAGQNMAQEQARVAQQLQRYQAEQSQANELYNQMSDQQRMALSIYDQMLQDEAQHWKEVYDPWAANLSAETSRYEADKKNAMTDYQRYLIARDKAEDEKAAAALKAKEAADKAAKEAAERAKANPYKNTYATDYHAKNPLEWLTTGGPAADVWEHLNNFMTGSNLGSYARYGR